MPSRGIARRLRRGLLWPLRRFFDPRLDALAAHISTHVSAAAADTRNHLQLVARDYHELGRQEQDELRRQLAELQRYVETDMDASVEASTLVGEALRDLDARAELIQEAMTDLTQAQEGRGPYFEGLRRAGLEGLDANAAAFLNHANSHVGFAAEGNLWFNWPIALHYEQGSVRVENVNERIVETAYALQALTAIEPGAAVLDVGATESLTALSLASLGFRVTALDPRPYPLSHPNLEVAVGTLEELQASEGSFAAVLCVSTLEHIGSGEYGQHADDEADAAALRRLHDVTEPGGVLVVTTPFGEASRGDGARVYDRPQLERLLHDWRIEDFRIAERVDATTWLPAAPGVEGAESVALITARKPRP